MVLRGHDDDLDRAVAIKLLRPSRGGGSRAGMRMQREARALARLAHPNVVTIYEVGTHEDQVYLVMEYIAGTTLRVWMAQDHDLDEILAVFHAAGSGLAAAHRAGIIHRDFKPDNVLIDDDGRVRVVDFGLAGTLSGDLVESDDRPDEPGPDDFEECHDLTRLTRTGDILGTPAYMAPEQFQGRRTDASTDLFAFCVVLHQALYGVRPFAGKSFATLAEAVLNGMVIELPRTRSAASARFRPVLLRGLATHPAERFASMDALLDALRAARRLRTRIPWLVVAALVIAALVIAALSRVDTSTSRPPDGQVAGVLDAGSVETGPITETTPTLRTRQITRAPGFGIRSAEADPSGRRLLYRDDEYRVWLRDIEGGRPEPVLFAGEHVDQATFGRDGDELFIRHDGILHRVRPAGEVSALGELGPDDDRHSVQVSPDGRLFAIFDEQNVKIRDRAWRLVTSQIDVVSDNGRQVAWSPDSRLAIVWSIVADETIFGLVDPRRGLLSSLSCSEIPCAGIAWLTSTTASTLTFRDGSAYLGCLRISDDGIQLDGVAALDGLPRGRFSRVVSRAGDDTVLLNASGQTRIAGILDLEGSPQLSLTSPDLHASDNHPIWLSSDEIAFTSNRYMTPSVLRSGRGEPSRVRAIGEMDVHSLTSDGDRGLVAVRGTEEQLYLEHARDPDDSPHRVFSAEMSLAGYGGIKCRDGRRCVVLLGKTFQELDLETGAMVELMECPPEYACRPVDWSLSPDGKQLLIGHSDRQHASVVDLGTGERRWTTPALAGVRFLQSSVWYPDGQSFLLSSMQQGGPKQDQYVIWRVNRDGSSRKIWSSSHTWVRLREMARDGTAVLLSGITMRFNLWLAELDGFCR